MSIGEIDESMAAANAATATSKKYDILPKASKAPVPVASKSVHANRDIGTSTTTTTSMTNHRPFYRSGGMVINLIGIVINLIAPLVILCRVPNDPMKTHEQSMYFIRVMLIAWLVALITTTRSKTTYCIFVVPTYIVSFIVLPMILQQQQQHQEEEPLLSSHATASYTWYNVARILCWTAVVASWKINICMSVCMHRYASHAAFKCGRYMNIGLCILGCAANQGGPLWWASQHRCHHKLRFMETDIYVHVYPYLLFCLHASMCRSLQYLTDQFFLCIHFCRFHPLPPVHRFCELPRDPHSPKQIGTERAFGFFLERFHVEEEFVPQHIQFPGLRLLDTWAFIVVSFELWFAYTFLGGNIALYIAFTSGWLSQTISLWFNIANHPIVKPSIDPNEKNLSKKVSSQCTASDDQAVMEPGIWYIPFYLLDAIVPMFSWLAMEDQHEHHHNHGNLAKRSPYDVAYWTFVKPLEMVGLVWNVVVK